MGWLYCTLRYDTRCYFNVRSKASKADISQLNLPHCAVEHSNSAKKVSIRFDNPINLPLVHWYWNSKLELIFIVCIFFTNESIQIDSHMFHNESIRIANWNALLCSTRILANYAVAQGTWGLEDESPPVEGSGRSPPPPESSHHITGTNIWLPNYAEFCVFSQTVWAAGKA